MIELTYEKRAASVAVERPLPQFRCSACGYGASCRMAPDRCPMCGGSTWEHADRNDHKRRL